MTANEFCTNLINKKMLNTVGIIKAGRSPDRIYFDAADGNGGRRSVVVTRNSHAIFDLLWPKAEACMELSL